MNSRQEEIQAVQEQRTALLVGTHVRRHPDSEDEACLIQTEHTSCAWGSIPKTILRVIGEVDFVGLKTAIRQIRSVTTSIFIPVVRNCAANVVTQWNDESASDGALDPIGILDRTLIHLKEQP